MQVLQSTTTNSIDIKPFRLAHEILVLDAFLQKPLDIRRYQSITRNFISELLTVLRMEPLGELGIYPAVDQRAPGWSFIQPITTSHVSAHYFEKPGRLPHIRIDAYSCDSVDWQRLIEVCDRHFGLAEWRASFIDRQIELPFTRKILDLSGEGGRVTTAHALSGDDVPLNGDIR